MVEKRATRYHFGDTSTSGLMVHEITRGVVVSPSQNSTKKMQLSVKYSTGAIKIVTTVIGITMPAGVGQTVK